MIESVLRVVQFVAGLLAFCGCGYYLLCIVSAYSFQRDSVRSKRAAAATPPFTPPVSILKPLRGTDRHMMECFRSHCRQDYPEYEIIFGVSEADDPAIALVEQLKREFPARRIELVFCTQKLGANVKVSNLVQMMAHAHHDHLIVNDSDILVGHDYLRRVIAPLASPRTGLVTALYRGADGTTIGSRLEALGIATEFAAGVLSARVVEGGVHFALGSTMAFTREALAAIGGFEPLLDYLADDYELGSRISRAGYEVVLSDTVVDTFLPDYDFGGYWTHQLRWMRSIKCSRGWGYSGLLFTFGLPFALLAVVAAHGALWSWLVLAGSAALRLAMAWATAVYVMHDNGRVRNFWLIPLRDVLAVAVWIAGYCSRTVVWRGDEFVLKDGKLAKTS
ncbi:MAG TPA: bacteriohopanetetrol glucosamine biosynthesis glycosyltransferase HpnI [Terriglobales bacterium]|nr:bacteriohopanetetrol glucosamine biosynthesis glycosyltransferase HpnI [Terriglobales bacterium]